MIPCFRCQSLPAETTTGTPLCSACWFSKIAHRSLGSRRLAPMLRALWREQQGRCAYTGTLLKKGENASLDHRTPASRGGAHDRPNLQWVTAMMNQLKADRTHEEFVDLLLLIVRHLGRV